MGDYLMAIWADRNTCKPFLGAGRIGHVVRIGPPKMTIVNEFTDGGRFQHEDCGPASLWSWLLDHTRVQTSVLRIEQIAGTGINGTSFRGLERAGAFYGQEIVFSPNNPQPGWIMNPGGGYIDPIALFPDYLRASQGGCLVLPEAVPKPQPIPEPVTSPPEEAMLLLFNAGPAGIWCLYEGKYFHITPDDLAAFEAVASKPMQTIGAAGHAVLVATYS